MNTSLHRIQRLLEESSPLVWVFAGDSITQGVVHTMGRRDYTELFAERIRWELQRRRDHIVNTGISGWRAGDLLKDVEWSILRHRPDIVSIFIGTNDCAADTGVTETTFREQYLKLIEIVRASGIRELILHTPNRILPHDPRRAGRIGVFAELVRAIAAQTDCLVVDHEMAWKPAEEAGTVTYWLTDAIHPNEFGHRALAHEIFRKLNIWDPQSRTCRLFVP